MALGKHSENVSAVILAAGMGTRMQSTKPKVLHELCGQPMVLHVINSLRKSGITRFGLVLSQQIDQFNSILESTPDLEVCIQRERRGTGDAVASSSVFFDGVKNPHFAQLELFKGQKKKTDHIIICAGDTPALDSCTVSKFISNHLEKRSFISVLGMEVDDPEGYGRLILSETGELSQIVEHKDASEEQRNIKICNSGVIIAEAKHLFECLDKLACDNVQKEYYLTDIIKITQENGRNVGVYLTDKWRCFMGVNTPEQKMIMEEFMNSLG